MSRKSVGDGEGAGEPLDPPTHTRLRVHAKGAYYDLTDDVPHERSPSAVAVQRRT